MKKKLLTLFVREVAASLEKEGHYGTAYRSTANSFEKYIAGECACSGNRIRCEKREVTMYSLSPGLLKRYEEWLRLRGLSWDTVGTYLHTLRATYNRGVEAGIAPYVPRLFTGVFTGRASERKRALDVKDVRSIFTGDTGGLSPELERARAFLELMLRFQGMPFVDLAHLQKSDYRNGRLVLRRQKTGVRLSIAVDRRGTLGSLCPCFSCFTLSVGHPSGKFEWERFVHSLSKFAASIQHAVEVPCFALWCQRESYVLLHALYMGYAKQVLRRSLIRDFRRIGAQQHKDHGDISETL